MSSTLWNSHNPTIRRIQADIRELTRHPSDQYAAHPLEDNMFDWHFVIRGPQGTDFEGGKYHGRIILPKDYPFKPPAIVLLTQNGRWQVNQKICLSISSYHPEQWQPAWGVRTILEALISFMTAPAEGAVGALDCSSEHRKQLAKDSLKYTHPLMPKLPELKRKEEKEVHAGNDEEEKTKERYQKQVAQLHEFYLGKVEAEPAVVSTENEITPGESPNVSVQENISSTPTVHDNSSEEYVEPTTQTVVEDQPQSEAVQNPPIITPVSRAQLDCVHVAPAAQCDSVDSWLHNLSIALMMAIFAVLYRKALYLYT